MTMNILFTIMWMQRATVEVGRHPEESAVPPWLRCSSDAFPPHPAPASLLGTRHCSQVLRPRHSHNPVSSARAVHS